MNKNRMIELIRAELGIKQMIQDLLKVAQEARTYLMSLPDKGNNVCSEYTEAGFAVCGKCRYDKYTHMCKSILAIGFEYK